MWVIYKKTVNYLQVSKNYVLFFFISDKEFLFLQPLDWHRWGTSFSILIISYTKNRKSVFFSFCLCLLWKGFQTFVFIFSYENFFSFFHIQTFSYEKVFHLNHFIWNHIFICKHFHMNSFSCEKDIFKFFVLLFLLNILFYIQKIKNPFFLYFSYPIWKKIPNFSYSNIHRKIFLMSFFLIFSYENISIGKKFS